MKKKIFIVLITLVLLFSAYYYWQNRYVEFRPVILAEENDTRRLLFFDNDLYKFAEPNEVPPNYYKHLRWVLGRSHVDYIEENGIIYVRNKRFNDMNLMWNYTTRATTSKFFKIEREMDSINLIYEIEYVESQKKIIDGFLKEIKNDSIK
ncbi:hypothetical protein GKZ90_0012790 [Flavobacterium sp. MC2016-06]|jgi:hypothetical protein|uniref:hypothetical protein n=1 Tax=Flavobacterium sp. MC2016-06 TaxID=2676308 RepID=UPI0012BAF507|nr:hypothetical protein [Flavobacterium sp. MC2016-06]MBU3860188.1 hypothetical protein [Flavobacterium sp. MC2016-06]